MEYWSKKELAVWIIKCNAALKPILAREQVAWDKLRILCESEEGRIIVPIILDEVRKNSPVGLSQLETSLKMYGHYAECTNDILNQAFKRVKQLSENSKPLQDLQITHGKILESFALLFAQWDECSKEIQLFISSMIEEMKSCPAMFPQSSSSLGGFISHVHSNHASVAVKIKKTIKRKYGMKFFASSKDIVGGDFVYEEIADALMTSKFFIAIIGHIYQDRAMCIIEILYAMGANYHNDSIVLVTCVGGVKALPYFDNIHKNLINAQAVICSEKQIIQKTIKNLYAKIEKQSKALAA